MLNHIKDTRFHFIGIGGIGMCGLAQLLHNQGAKVSGSDMNESSQTQRLVDLGVKVFIGHDKTQVKDSDVVVYSSAIKSSNEEFSEALKNKIPMIPRAEALAELMRLKRGIAIAGTHGKTTTTSLLTSLLIDCKMDPTAVVGGRLEQIASTAQLGLSDWFVAEADESDGSFHKLTPEVVVITNIDNDHLDHYKTFENLKGAFLSFAEQIPFYGTAVVCGDVEQTRKVFDGFRKKIVFYGFSETNDYYIKGDRGEYTIYKHGQEFASLSVPLPGKHNALNALAAFLCGVYVGCDKSDIKNAIDKFRGVDRRFQFIGTTSGGAEVYDDYAHHPTEVKATLQACKEKFPDKTVHIIFQPHRFTRFQNCWDEFLESFELADKLYVSEVYPAGEKPIAKITHSDFAKSISHPNVNTVGDLDNFFETLSKNLGAQDVVMTLGAGNLWRYARKLVG